MENTNPSSLSLRNELFHLEKKIKIKLLLENSGSVDSLVSLENKFEEEEEDDLEYFDTFPTIEELGYHKWLLKNPRPSRVNAKGCRAGDHPVRTDSRQVCPARDRLATVLSVGIAHIAAYSIIGNKMGDTDINTLTMEQYVALTHGNQAPSVVKPEIGGNVNFEIKSQFMRELREDTFSRNKNDDAYEHVEKILDIVSLFNISRVTHDAVMLRVFPITLTRAAKRWVDILSPGTINTWDLLKKAFIQRRVNHDKSDGIAAITNKLDSLGRDMKKLKENVHAIQVGCENYRGAHLNKDCLIHEEVKSMKEVKYGEFGQPFSNNNGTGARYRVGLPGYYTRVDNRPPFREKKPSLEELMNKHLEESTRRRA
ncbi:hypothetical protein Tco_1218722 [Tanacetum coccineum]